MTYGNVARSLRPLALVAGLLFTFPAHADRPGPAAAVVTLIFATAPHVQVQDEAGRTLNLTVSPASWLLRRGLRVSAEDFSPGETLVLRQHVGPGGRPQVSLLCDAESDAAIERYRRRPLVGTLVSQSPREWVVLPSDSPDGVPLTLPVSARTRYRVGGVASAASAFGPGTEVQVVTRALPGGPLSAVSVSEAADTDTTVGETRRAGFLSGTVLDVQPDAGTLTVQDKVGAPQVVGVDTKTRVKVRRRPASLTDIAAGMRVSVRLGVGVDAAGNSVATSVSALDAAAARKRR